MTGKGCVIPDIAIAKIRNLPARMIALSHQEIIFPNQEIPDIFFAALQKFRNDEQNT